MTRAEPGQEHAVVVRDIPDANQYVIEVDGVEAGKAVYHMRGGRHFFVHTEIDDAHSGRGLGSVLVQRALDDVREKGGVVVPICPLFASYLDSHPEYRDMVDEEITARINRAH